MNQMSNSANTIFILNEKNVLITKEFINKIFQKYNLNHKVVDLSLYIQALTHPSYNVKSYAMTDNGYHKTKEISSNRFSGDTKNLVPLQETSYDRLEFLGDAIIHEILTYYIYDRFIDQQEGFMTKLRTRLENSETLAKFTQVLGLDNYILLSRYVEENNGRHENIHILEDVFEAFIGVVFIDSGHKSDICRSLLKQLIENEIDIAEILHNENNYKDILLRHAHTKKWPDPIYGTRNVSSNQKMSSKTFEMFVKIKGVIEGTGVGTSKVKGEQLAAKMALKKFKVLHDDQDESEEEYEL